MLLLVTLLSGEFCASSSGTADEANKIRFVQQIQWWVAQQQNVALAQVEVSAIDRRLQIPDCIDFKFKFPFPSSRQTVQAQCSDPIWQAFIGVKITRTYAALRYKRNLLAGHQLNVNDVITESLERPLSGLMTDPEQLNEFSLSVAVRSGDLVMNRQLSENVEVFISTRDILTGEALTKKDITQAIVGKSTVNRDQLFSNRLLVGALAARPILQGAVLSRRDIKQKHQVLVSRTGLTAGQKLTPTNTKLDDYYGKLPSDAVFKLQSVEQMAVTRQLRAGELVRLSDLKPIPYIYSGDTVQLTVSKGLLTVTLPMVALEDGQLEQRILLLNPESGEKVQAIVSGVGRAQGL